MKRTILLACTGVLLAACASGADVADDRSSPDSAVMGALEDAAPGQSADSAGTQAP
jgi:hypothetical protein